MDPVPSSASDQLVAVMREVVEAAEVARRRYADLTAAALDAVNLAKVSWTAEAVSRLPDVEPGLVTQANVVDALLYAQTLRRVLVLPDAERPRSGDLELAASLSDRIMEVVGYLSAAKAVPAEPQQNATAADTSDVSENGGALSTRAEVYEEDAKRERRIVLALYSLALVLLVAAVVASFDGIDAASGRTAFAFDEFTAYGLVAFVLVCASGLAVRNAERHNRAAQEALRLQRQLSGLDDYLSPMTAGASALVRGALVQRLFPSVPGEDEPWREPNWPSTSDLIEMINADRGLEAEEFQGPERSS